MLLKKVLKKGRNHSKKLILTLLLAGTGVYYWDDPVISLLWTKEGSRRKKVNMSNGLQSMVNKILYSTVL